jgi:hypothetical protein
LTPIYTLNISRSAAGSFFGSVHHRWSSTTRTLVQACSSVEAARRLAPSA